MWLTFMMREPMGYWTKYIWIRLRLHANSVQIPNVWQLERFAVEARLLILDTV